MLCSSRGKVPTSSLHFLLQGRPPLLSSFHSGARVCAYTHRAVLPPLANTHIAVNPIMHDADHPQAHSFKGTS
eukprot:scaffold133308_cov15-Tisochrysis_lutea.AAC.1